jgi:CheY-like chemotaxis protein
MPVMDGADATRAIRDYEAAHGLRRCLIYMGTPPPHTRCGDTR